MPTRIEQLRAKHAELVASVNTAQTTSEKPSDKLAVHRRGIAELHAQIEAGNDQLDSIQETLAGPGLSEATRTALTTDVATLDGVIKEAQAALTTLNGQTAEIEEEARLETEINHMEKTGTPVPIKAAAPTSSAEFRP